MTFAADTGSTRGAPLGPEPLGPTPGRSPGLTMAALFDTTCATARRIEAWLDARGKWAWLATMVAGFCLAPPVGLLILGYMIWSKRMFGQCTARRDRHTGFGRSASRPSGNSAFDAYRADTLRRLSEEQEAFDAFLTRLREARDKSEFDRFMDERAARASETPAASAPEQDETAPRRGEY